MCAYVWPHVYARHMTNIVKHSVLFYIYIYIYIHTSINIYIYQTIPKQKHLFHSKLPKKNRSFFFRFDSSPISTHLDIPP